MTTTTTPMSHRRLFWAGVWLLINGTWPLTPWGHSPFDLLVLVDYLAHGAGVFLIVAFRPLLLWTDEIVSVEKIRKGTS